MPDKKQLWLLAGGNGAGKSIFYSHYLSGHGIKFVNADLIARKIKPDSPKSASYEAAYAAKLLSEDMLNNGISFCYETVFSHPSKIDFLGEARAKGYEIILVYIHLVDSSLNEARVYQRTCEGGHDVPIEKIHSRIPRTMKHIRTALEIVHEAWILDNSSESDRFKQIAVLKNGTYEIKVDPIPKWLKELIPIGGE